MNFSLITAYSQSYWHANVALIDINQLVLPLNGAAVEVGIKLAHFKNTIMAWLRVCGIRALDCTEQ